MTAKLQKREALKLHDAEIAVAKAKRALEDAEERRQELRARYIDRVPLSEDPEEAAKGVRTTVAGGIKVRITPQVSGAYFNLSAYIKAGEVVTSAMGRHIRDGKEYDRWTVTGPPKAADAVEPRR